MAKNEKQRPVLVTTQHRGVFVGDTVDPADANTITLTNARMVVYWTAESHGVLGIARRGLFRGAKISPAIARITLRDITAVVDATPEAVKSWESEPWG